MQLNLEGLRDAAFFERAGIALPRFDVAQMARTTKDAPAWLHIGAGNIFRALVCAAHQDLLDEGLAHAGITAVVSADSGALADLWSPHDNLSMLCTLHPDGRVGKRVIASVGEAVSSNDASRLRAIYQSPGLQLVSLTITEKGYALPEDPGTPENPLGAMAELCRALIWRFEAGALPLALVSMDNCASNGDMLRAALLGVARRWREKGLAPDAFVGYIENRDVLSFPLSMIDKIVPRPFASVQAKLRGLGFTDMDIRVTKKNTHIAPFVNAEPSEHLVIEDSFPNGRPPLERAGVMMASREVVADCERMKVTACLNPVHTAQAIFGCLLGYTLIADEMQDAQLRALAVGVGREGMAVAPSPAQLPAEAFFRELIERRLPNPHLGDSPQRIASDTSQKIPVRYGVTIQSYLRQGRIADLRCIPFVIAGWLRYLQGIDDAGKPFVVSPDPLLDALKRRTIDQILADAAIFGGDLCAIGLRDQILTHFQAMQGEGAVRRALKEFTK